MSCYVEKDGFNIAWMFVKGVQFVVGNITYNLISEWERHGFAEEILKETHHQVKYYCHKTVLSRARFFSRNETDMEVTLHLFRKQCCILENVS